MTRRRAHNGKRRPNFVHALTGIYRAMETSERGKRIQVAGVLVMAGIVALEVIIGAIILIVHGLIG